MPLKNGITPCRLSRSLREKKPKQMWIVSVEKVQGMLSKCFCGSRAYTVHVSYVFCIFDTLILGCLVASSNSNNQDDEIRQKVDGLRFIYWLIHTYLCTYLHTYRQTYIQTYIYIQTNIQPYRLTDIQTYRHTDIHTYIHLCIHPCIHT